MSVHLNRKLAITLLFSLALLLAFARPSSANGISPDSPSRRDHHHLNRMIKRRVANPPVARQIPGNDPGGAIGAGANPPEDSSSSTPSSTPSSPSSAAQPSSLVASSSLVPSSVASSSAVQSLSSTLSSSSSSTISSTAPATTSTSTSSTLSTPSTSDTPTPTTQKDTASATGNGQSISIQSVTLTSHVAAASSSAANNSQLGASSLSRTTITILIVLAASIGGCAIVWTIIRKWKFRPSDKFEDRLEPVDWQPTEHDSSLPTHRRMTSNASSFHSAGHDNIMGLSRSNSGGAYNAGRSLSPLPDHDFTAGAATLAPGGGYADLARGPSPQPQMQEALHRGPSVNRGYGDYPAPAHHYQGGQEAYDYGNAGPRY